MSVCLSVCLHSNSWKITRAINIKLGRPIVHVRNLACTDREVKRSKVKFFFNVCIYSMSDINTLQSLAVTVDRRSAVHVGLVCLHCDIIMSLVTAASMGSAR